MLKRLILRGRLRNPLYCRNGSTKWIRGQKYLFIRRYSTALPVQDISKHSTTSGWLFQNLSSEAGVPLPPKAVLLRDAIDWEAVNKIFEKRPHLAQKIRFRKLKYCDVSFVDSLGDLSGPLRHRTQCKFEYDHQHFKNINQIIHHCSLTYDLLGEPPLKFTASATTKMLAQNAAALQLILVLEDRQLLDVLLSLISQKWTSQQAKVTLKIDDFKPAESASEVTNGSSKMTPTLPVPSVAKIDPIAEKNPTEEPKPAIEPQTEARQSHRLTYEVFNYAAKYLYIPKYIVTSQPDSTWNSSSNSSNELHAPKSIFTVVIFLPEHGICATETGFNLGVVEATACVKFKKEVEKYHIATSMPSQPSDGSIVLSTANAINFIDFYNDYNAKVVIEVIQKDNLWVGQAFDTNSKSNARELLGQTIRRNSTKGLETLISLVAAVTIVKKRPELLLNYMEKLDSGTGKYVAKALPIKLELHQSSLDLMRRTLESTSKLGLSIPLTNEPVGHTISFLNLFQISEQKALRRSDKLLKWYRRSPRNRKDTIVLPLNKYSSEVLNLVENSQYSILVGQTGSGKTTQLPQTILDNYIRTKRGGFCRIVCTQPRRIAAKSVADHVAKQRGQKLGDQVGYKISSDAIFPNPRGSITYCTTGIILQYLIHHPDDLLDNITHLIVDEVHERDINIELLLTILKTLINARTEAGKSSPRVCFMSATVDAEMLQEYFAFTDNFGVEVTCPIIHVEGRAFPVEQHFLENIMDILREAYPEGHPIRRFLESKANQSYLESEEQPTKTYLVDDVKNEKAEPAIRWDIDDDTDSLQNQMRMNMMENRVPVDLAAIVTAHIASTTEDGAILIFLPGLHSINITDTVLRTQKFLKVDFNDEEKFKIFKLHSSTSEENREIFESVPPGCRKIILATNIVESSITIDDIQYVVDTGKHREPNFHQMSRISSLPHKWVSKSSVKQRSGRAGRVQNGSYYALFSKCRYDSLRKVARPELLRADLQATCLSIKYLGYKESIRDFFASTPEPPSTRAVQSSIESLKKLGALTNTETITPLGRLLGELPLRPALGKMIILGIIYRCLEPMIILGALNNEVLQLRPLNMEEQSDAAMKGFAKTSKSDHIAMLNAFRALRDLEKVHGPKAMIPFAHQKFLSINIYRRVKQVIELIQQNLQVSGLVPNIQGGVTGECGVEYGGTLLNENSSQDDLIRALLVHGLYPHIGTWDNYKSKYHIIANEKALVSIHPSSTNHPMQRPRLKPKGITSPSTRNAQLLSFDSLSLLSDKKLVMQSTTAVTPFMASLFSGTLTQSNVDIDKLEVDRWLPFIVQSTDELMETEGAAAQTLLGFNHALRRLEKIAFRELAERKHIINNELYHIFANALKELLIAEQDIDRIAEDYEFDLSTGLQKFWSPLKTLSEDIPPESLLEEETLQNESSDRSFIELVESALEAPITTNSHSDAASPLSQAKSESFASKSKIRGYQFRKTGVEKAARGTKHNELKHENTHQSSEKSPPNDSNNASKASFGISYEYSSHKYPQTRKGHPNDPSRSITTAFHIPRHDPSNHKHLQTEVSPFKKINNAFIASLNVSRDHLSRHKHINTGKPASTGSNNPDPWVEENSIFWKG